MQEVKMNLSEFLISLKKKEMNMQKNVYARVYLNLNNCVFLRKIKVN